MIQTTISLPWLYTGKLTRQRWKKRDILNSNQHGIYWYTWMAFSANTHFVVRFELQFVGIILITLQETQWIVPIGEYGETISLVKLLTNHWHSGVQYYLRWLSGVISISIWPLTCKCDFSIQWPDLSVNSILNFFYHTCKCHLNCHLVRCEGILSESYLPQLKQNYP